MRENKYIVVDGKENQTESSDCLVENQSVDNEPKGFR